MGLTRVEMNVAGPSGKDATIEFLVDSGASYSVIPHKYWRKLKLQPKREMKFTLADGTSVTRKLSQAHFTYQDIDASSTVVLGEPNDEALLGAVTLEELGLVLNPFDRTLRPMRMMLA